MTGGARIDAVIAFVAQWLLILPALLVVFSIIQRRRWKRDLGQAVLESIAVVVAVKLASLAFSEPRPFVVENVAPLIPHAADNSFPSDHLAACGLAFTYLWPRSEASACVTFAVAALIAMARVAARVHWPIDVAAGFLIGAIAAAIVVARQQVLRAVSAVLRRLRSR